MGLRHHCLLPVCRGWYPQGPTKKVRINDPDLFHLYEKPYPVRKGYILPHDRRF